MRIVTSTLPKIPNSGPPKITDNFELRNPLNYSLPCHVYSKVDDCDTPFHDWYGHHNEGIAIVGDKCSEYRLSSTKQIAVVLNITEARAIAKAVAEYDAKQAHTRGAAQAAPAALPSPAPVAMMATPAPAPEPAMMPPPMAQQAIHPGDTLIRPLF